MKVCIALSLFGFLVAEDQRPVCKEHPRSVMHYEGPVPADYHYLAPDGSEIRLVTEVQYGGLAHCTLPVNAVTEPVLNQSVEEIWYFLEGEGLLWRNQAGEERVTPVSKGMTVVIVPGVPFQFRNVGEVPLTFLIVTMPPWPGASESVKVAGYW